MYNLLRIFNQNRRQILIAILAIVFVIVILQILNTIAKKENEEKIENILSKKNEINTSSYEPSYSVINGNNVSKQTNETVQILIDTFVNMCNQGKIEEAYKLLSTDCKKEIYPTLNSFKVYYDSIFNTKKNYTIQLWTSSSLTYKIEFMQDAMATGKISNTGLIQDFYTIVKENDENKLNISEYIGKINIGESTTVKGITIKANYKNVFKDYEIYNISIKNKSENNILLDSKKSTKTVYLSGSESAQYSSFLYEVDNNDLSIDKNFEKTINIKFAKQYATKAKIDEIVFSDVILNSDEYKKNPKEYLDKISIKIEL